MGLFYLIVLAGLRWQQKSQCGINGAASSF